MLRLPQIALDIIAAQPVLAGNPYVFAGSKRGQRRVKGPDDDTVRRPPPPCFNSWSACKATLDAKMPKGTERWTIHDLRRTARSLMSRAGVQSDIAERVMGHAIEGVEGVYDRYEYLDEKAAALDKLAKLIGTIINPPAGENVVPMTTKRSRKHALA